MSWQMGKAANAVPEQIDCNRHIGAYRRPLPLRLRQIKVCHLLAAYSGTRSLNRIELIYVSIVILCAYYNESS